MPRTVKIEHHPLVKRFAARLRELRRERGLSQVRLAVTAGITISYVGKLERAESAPGLDLVGRLAETLGVPPNSLLETPRDTKGLERALAAQARREFLRFEGAQDAPSLQAMSVLLAHWNRSLSRRR